MNNIVSFLFEIGQLKRVARSGWWLAGIKDPETVAEHSFRTAVIGYILAGLEGADADRCAIMCLFHDVSEARINDLHKVAKRYIQTDAAENQVLEEQLKQLPEGTSTSIKSCLMDLNGNKSIEATIAHDADALECLIQALEYKAVGYQDVQEWIESSFLKLRTASAIELAKKFIEGSGRIWWDENKKYE